MRTENNICNGKDDTGCGGTIGPNRSDGRFYSYKGVLINLSSKIIIPRCDKCKADLLSDKLIIFIDKILEWEYNEHRELIQEALERDKFRA